MFGQIAERQVVAGSRRVTPQYTATSDVILVRNEREEAPFKGTPLEFLEQSGSCPVAGDGESSKMSPGVSIVMGGYKF